ncbi:uncharacterized protein LOC134818198 [Bolinopsis microptera]|uniref:uncharacterized protein LOC134818198 n=1 Tax=Bolinopsis microptera TaxID=2820187 RepID=UPI003079C64F
MMSVTLKKPVIIGLTCGALFVLFLLHQHYTAYPTRLKLPSSCIRPDNIENLLDILNTSNSGVKRPKCYEALRGLMDRIYRVEISGAEVRVPKSMVELVRDKWFGGDVDLYAKFEHPRVMIVSDRYTSQTSTVNPLRALRPKPSNGGEEKLAVEKIIADSKPGCNFCNDKQTLEDTFGRVYWEKSHIFTAENAFRFYDYTGMVIPADIHNFMDVDAQTFETMLTYSALTWFGNIHERHPEKTHPVLVWDVLGKAGASQVHPHIQMFVGSGFYPGKFGEIDDAGKRYKADTGGNYLQDIVDLHIALGLGFKHKSAAVIVPINPTKDREIWVVGKDNVFDWAWLYFISFRAYIEELEVYCVSQGIALPTAEIAQTSIMSESGELMIVKMGARGDCTSPYNDVSSLELYSVNSISTDYYETIAAVHKTYETYKTKNPEKYEGV